MIDRLRPELRPTDGLMQINHVRHGTNSTGRHWYNWPLWISKDNHFRSHKCSWYVLCLICNITEYFWDSIPVKGEAVKTWPCYRYGIYKQFRNTTYISIRFFSNLRAWFASFPRIQVLFWAIRFPFLKNEPKIVPLHCLIVTVQPCRCDLKQSKANEKAWYK